jgi:adenine-specific DNA methylase
MTDTPRLIEHAFPLKQTSLDSVHEKNVRHGHISTLHIWPARRPLAACRAALIATLLPDPSAQPKPEGMSDEEWHKEIVRRRQELCEKIGGTVVKKIERKKMPNGETVEREKEITQGGILHWGRETENKELLDWFRKEIRKAYGGLPAPRPGKFYIYVIKCKDDSFYIGQTDDIPRRFEEHEAGHVQWTSVRKPLHVIHWEEFDSREEAVRREHDLKTGWGREWIKREYAAGRTRQAGRAPKVLDPFAGGGAIPLEAMRLGCEATAVDINPVAWFILKCTLEYPQKLAGKKHPLPDFILENEEFMDAFYKAHPHLIGRTKRTKKQEKNPTLFDFDKQDSGRAPKADLAWHVRAWGQWVLNRARRELARYYPTYADFEPLKPGHVSYELQPMRLVPLKDDLPAPDGTCGQAGGLLAEASAQAGTPDINTLNAEFSEEYLADKRNPRWVAKPTVAYLWARTVKCKNCRAVLPLLKTRWLCKKDKKRVLLTMEVKEDKTPTCAAADGAASRGVVFGIEINVPMKGGNAAQRREHDKRIGAGTMSRSGAKCPCCGAIMTMEDIRLEGQAGRLGATNTAVVADGQKGKEYRLPTAHEIQMADEVEKAIPALFSQIPFGMPTEPLPSKDALGFRVPLYGFDQWNKLFTSRQLLSLGTFVKWTRAAKEELTRLRYASEWVEPISAYLAIQNDKVADYNSMVCVWHISRELIGHTFTRFALPITWDFTELAVTNDVGGAYPAQLDWVSRYIDHGLVAGAGVETPLPQNQSAIQIGSGNYDAVVTDPPYYDAIPYSDLMDFFYLWLKRSLNGLSPELDVVFKEALSPKWNNEKNDGELIDDASRHEGDKAKSKAVYENGMARVFQGCGNALKPDGKMVVAFANKQPGAWETLVSALIRSGFVVDGSWPIQTEMSTRMRAKASAALASSVWLVCKKRPATARPGWDNQVLEEMRQNIREKLREFWDAGIRGPDFVWAATGPAMEAYSKHPVVKKANEPGPMTVSEFLTHVRRMVVDFVVGRVLVGEKEGDAELAAADRLDEPTAYYLLHRHDFGLDEAPAGACILYAISCGISDKELADTWDLIGFTKGKSSDESEEEEADADAETDPDAEENSGSKVKLKTWAQRKGRSLGYEAPSGKPVPLIDRVHCLMHLWKAGDLSKVDEYLDSNGLRRQELFKRLLQSLIELSPHGSEERSLLESISNHVQTRGAVMAGEQLDLNKY